MDKIYYNNFHAYLYSDSVYFLWFCRHYPVGVLFDLYGSENQLPWNITVHFQVIRKIHHLLLLCHYSYKQLARFFVYAEYIFDQKTNLVHSPNITV